MRYLIFFLCFVLPLHAKQTLCLNMIVKNEAHVIKRCLDSVKEHIDYWVIVDTGSTDGTQEVIKNHLKEIPGELHERPWKNFGHNRSEALELAKNKADYLLFIDADDWLEFETGVDLTHLDKDLYEMWRGTEDFQYLIPQIVKGDLPWKWVGVVHEYLALDRPPVRETLKGVRYVSGADGASHHDKEKFQKYIALLEKGLEEEPNNERYVFYLAESYRDAGETLKAANFYMKRASMGGWPEEVFWSLLQTAKLLQVMKAPFDVVAESYGKAHRLRPHRPEPVYYYADYCIKEKRYDLAYEAIQGWKLMPKTSKKDVLFNEEWTNIWGIDFQLSLAAYYLDHFKESLEICDALLNRKLTEHVKKQVLDNRKFPAEKLGL